MLMFETRGYLLDVSRERVPTMKTLREVVDLLALCRYNQFQLYVGRPGSAAADGDGWDAPETLAADELARLGAYCALQGIDLATNAAPRADDVAGCPADTLVAPWFWADALLRDPTLLPRVPQGAVALVHGTAGGHPFAAELETLRRAGVAAWVCPDTSAARSLAGRVENMRENLEAAERAGRLGGAKGYLLTDWGDGGGWQPLAASLPAIILGGAFAATGAKAAKMDLEVELDRVMDAPLGGLLLRLGTLYLRGGAVRPDASELFNILSHDCGYSRHPGLTDGVLDEISGIAAGVRVAAERWTGRNDWAKEIVYMANLVDCACHRRDGGRLRALREEHGRIWRLRSRDGGRVASLARLPRF